MVIHRDCSMAHKRSQYLVNFFSGYNARISRRTLLTRVLNSSTGTMSYSPVKENFIFFAPMAELRYEYVYEWAYNNNFINFCVDLNDLYILKKSTTYKLWT